MPHRSQLYYKIMSIKMTIINNIVLHYKVTMIKYILEQNNST